MPDTKPAIGGAKGSHSEYVSRRAAELIDESDKGLNMFDAEAMGRWIGAATEILRELTHA